MKTKSLLIPATLGIALIAGCATNDPAQRTKTGAAIGAVAGAVLGHQVDGDKGRFVGAVAGALAGGAVGQYMDEQQRQLEADLEAERAASEIEISRLADDTLRLDVSSEVSFAVDSAQITPAFFGSLDKIAAVVADYPQTAVHIVGHTDSSGSDNYNYKLSLRRASSVQQYLTGRSVDAARTRKAGRGETRPIADNSTSQGRSRNRRVEIYLRPIIEGREAEAFRAPV